VQVQLRAVVYCLQQQNRINQFDFTTWTWEPRLLLLLLCACVDVLQVDEYNLLYVAATRAKLALIVNPDLEKLLLNGSHRPLLLQVGPVAKFSLTSVSCVQSCASARMKLITAALARHVWTKHSPPRQVVLVAGRVCRSVPAACRYVVSAR
jgi:hypothetical protein